MRFVNILSLRTLYAYTFELLGPPLGFIRQGFSERTFVQILI